MKPAVSSNQRLLPIQTAINLTPENKMKILIVQGEHQYVPGRPMTAWKRQQDADAEALKLVNMIRVDAGLPVATEDWKAALLEAQIKLLGDDVDPDLDLTDPDEVADQCEADVWITVLDLN